MADRSGDDLIMTEYVVAHRLMTEEDALNSPMYVIRDKARKHHASLRVQPVEPARVEPPTLESLRALPVNVANQVAEPVIEDDAQTVIYMEHLKVEDAVGRQMARYRHLDHLLGVLEKCLEGNVRAIERVQASQVSDETDAELVNAAHSSTMDMIQSARAEMQEILLGIRTMYEAKRDLYRDLIRDCAFPNNDIQDRFDARLADLAEFISRETSNAVPVSKDE